MFRKNHRYLTGLLVRTFIVLVLLATAFGLKSAGFEFSEHAVETVRSAVTYDIPAREDDGMYLLNKIIRLFKSFF